MAKIRRFAWFTSGDSSTLSFPNVQSRPLKAAVFLFDFCSNSGGYPCTNSHISFHCTDFCATKLLHQWNKMCSSLPSPVRSHEYWFRCVHGSPWFLHASVFLSVFSGCSGPLGFFSASLSWKLPCTIILNRCSSPFDVNIVFAYVWAR